MCAMRIISRVSRVSKCNQDENLKGWNVEWEFAKGDSMVNESTDQLLEDEMSASCGPRTT